MFEKEEEKLSELRTQLEHVDIPQGEIDGAILQGMERAKREKQVRRIKRKKGLWTLAVSAVVLITLVTSIRVSPAFANAVGSIPGMDKIVSLIQFDKGITSAIENDYYQRIGVSQTKESLTLTVDGVILDESGMNVFYTLDSSQSLEQVEVKSINLKNKTDISQSSIGFNTSNNGKLENENVYTDRIDYHFSKPIQLNDLNFIFNMVVTLNGKDFKFSVPFLVPENVKPSITFTLNEDVEIEDQNFTVENITIHPLRVEVAISFNPNNSMEILKFEDMRLEDENGEVWGSIANGVSGRDISDTEQVYFLQSNYFEKPKELYLRINKLQALDKDEALVIIDTEKNLLLNSPKDGRLHLGDSSKSHADFFLTGVINEDEELNSTLVTSVKDATGKVIRTPSTGMYYDSDKMESHWEISFETTNYKNPLHLELFAYPNYIKGDVKVELKNLQK